MIALTPTAQNAALKITLEISYMTKTTFIVVIVLVQLSQNIVLKTRKHFQAENIQFKKSP